jgi:hypothetical protein
MNSKDPRSLGMNRRNVLRGACGLMLGLPVLETFMPRRASAQAAMRSPFVLIVVGDNGVVQTGVTLSGSGEPEKFWPTQTGLLTKDKLVADKATRAIGELADYAEKLMIVRGVNLPFSSNGCSHSAADAQILTAANITPGSTNCKAKGISVDTAIAQAKNPPGRDPLVLHAGMFSPGGTGFDIPGYVSYVTPEQPRVYIDSPYKAYQKIIGVIGDGSMGNTAEIEAERLRALRSKSINDVLRPQIQALLSRSDLSQSDHDRLDQHLTAIRDIEVKLTETTLKIPEADVTTMQGMDPKPYDQATRDAAVLLFMDLMAFSAAADYSRVAVLKIGDRIDDHVYSFNGQSAKFHDVSHRQVSNSVDFHHYIDRMMLNYYKHLLDKVAEYETPTGPLMDQGVTIWTNQCATGAHSFSNIPWLQVGTANGYYRQGEYVVVGDGEQPGGSQDGKGGDASVSGINKMLNTLLNAAGVTKTDGSPTDDFGDSTLPNGYFPEMIAGT